jgi:hypothetical protein
MTESSTHVLLVSELLQWVDHNIIPRDDLCILVDSLSSSPDSRPPPIGGKVPDVYVKSVGSDRLVLIGEAKTSLDVETEHTRDQFRDYLDHLKSQRVSILLIAVPWHKTRLVQSIVRRVQEEQNAQRVSVYILENLPG